jgi:hypothetical protein
LKFMKTDIRQFLSRIVLGTALGFAPSSSLAATFTDTNWISMNHSLPGTDGQVNAAAVDGSGNLYIGGDFTVVGNVIANHIAKWNGSSWSALGSGLGGPPGTSVSVSALAVSGSDLYAARRFTTAGGTVNYIAKWDGSSWSALGSGMDSNVLALAVSGNDLYAGGAFTNAGGSAANYIAKWDRSSWSALGSGMNNPVYALAVLGSDLYAGGIFTTAGGSAATNIAKWDGSSWSALSSGVSWYGDPGASVYALAVSGSDLYAGGYFTTAGGNPANYISKWDGSSWSALGSGMGGFDPYVSALAVSGSDLYAGGGFSTAGGKISAYVARAIINPPVLAIFLHLAPAHNSASSLRPTDLFPHSAFRIPHLVCAFFPEISPWLTGGQIGPPSRTNGRTNEITDYEYSSSRIERTAAASQPPSPGD